MKDVTPPPPVQVPAKPDMQTGDVVFFKKAKTGIGKGAREYGFKGHAFGILMGYIPPNIPEPKPEDLLQMMGRIGFLRFDDIADFFGDDTAKECVQKFEDKYYGKEIPDEKVPSNIVGIDGKPVN